MAGWKQTGYKSDVRNCLTKFFVTLRHSIDKGERVYYIRMNNAKELTAKNLFAEIDPNGSSDKLIRL